MNKDHFAKNFGFADYQEMQENTSVVFQDKGISWCVSKLPHDERFLAWDDAEIADDRVEVFLSRQDAESYLHGLRNVKH